MAALTAEMEPRLGRVAVLLGGGGFVDAYYDHPQAAPFRKSSRRWAAPRRSWPSSSRRPTRITCAGQPEGPQAAHAGRQARRNRAAEDGRGPVEGLRQAKDRLVRLHPLRHALYLASALEQIAGPFFTPIEGQPHHTCPDELRTCTAVSFSESSPSSGCPCSRRPPGHPCAAGPAAADRQAVQAHQVRGPRDPKTTLGELLDQWGKQYDLTFDVNEKAFHSREPPGRPQDERHAAPPRPMKNVRLDTVLRKVLAQLPVPSGATWTLRADLVEITTNAFQTAEIWGEYNGPHLPLVWRHFRKSPLDDARRSWPSRPTSTSSWTTARRRQGAKTPVSAAC